MGQVRAGPGGGRQGDRRQEQPGQRRIPGRTRLGIFGSLCIVYVPLQILC